MILDATPAAGRLFIRLGALGGLLGVAAGAFGAHLLGDALGPERLAWWETGARYLLVHALALVGTGILVPSLGGRAAPAAGWLFALGAPLFSGSLFVLALGGARAWGAVTPFGGTAWLAAWALLAVAAGRPSRAGSARTP